MTPDVNLHMFSLHFYVLVAKLEDSSQASSATNNDGSVDLDQLVCYNCRASHDYSDEAKYTLNNPFFDPCNAVLLWDAPNCRAQAFHQRCHFVPIFSIPRGEWICLLCQYEQSLQKKTTKHFAKAATVAESQPVANASSLSVSAGDDTALLKKFDREAANLKAEATQVQLSRLGKSIEHSLSNIRTAEHTISFYTNTERLRKDLVASFPRIPSELLHAKIKCSQNKFKIRQQLLSLKRYISDPPPRPEPRFAKVSNINGSELQHDLLEQDNSSEKERKQKSANSDDSENQSVSESDIVCCVCHDGTSNPHNDIILCDGLKCKRAFHMKCIRPKLNVSDLQSQKNDWFCPFCDTLRELTRYAQETYYGDHGYSPDSPWKTADDVFPEAKIEYTVALLLKERKAPLKALFGEVTDLADLGDDMNIGSSDDDDEEFDEEDSSDENSLGSVSTSSTDSENGEGDSREIAKNELRYLSDADESSNSGYAENSEKRKRQKAQIASISDPGKFDKKNIVQGKRRRSNVDYTKLNSALFGDSSVSHTKKTVDIDDDDEFEHTDLSDNSGFRYTSSRSSDDSEASSQESPSENDSVSEDRDCISVSKKTSVANYVNSHQTAAVSFRSKRRRAPINYKLLAGENSSGESSDGSQNFHPAQKIRRKIGSISRARKENVVKSQASSYPRSVGYSSMKLEKFKNQATNGDSEKEEGKVKKRKKSFCTCKNSKCLKLYCLCFSQQRKCIPGVCKCRDCRNSIVAQGDNCVDSGPAQKNGTSQQSPHELLLALKMDDPADNGKVASDDLPSLLLSLKNTEKTPSSTPDVSFRQNAWSSNVKPRKLAPSNAPDVPVSCSCRKSSCLKLYCYCNSQGAFCNDECECRRCLNKPEGQLESIMLEELTSEDGKMSATPCTSSNTYRKTVPLAEENAVLVGRKHGAVLKNLGCSCRRSKCIKLYCVCWSNKIKCSSLCTCFQCSNVPFSPEGRYTGSIENEAVEPSFEPSSSRAKQELPLGINTDLCSCKKSKCLALYCPCYASGSSCTESCACMGCLNKGSRMEDSENANYPDCEGSSN